MRQFFRIVGMVLGLAVFGNFADAHHSQAGIFDSSKTIEVTGVVKSVSWRNPHGQILLAVKERKASRPSGMLKQRRSASCEIAALTEARFASAID